MQIRAERIGRWPLEWFRLQNSCRKKAIRDIGALDPDLTCVRLVAVMGGECDG